MRAEPQEQHGLPAAAMGVLSRGVGPISDRMGGSLPTALVDTSVSTKPSKQIELHSK